VILVFIEEHIQTQGGDYVHNEEVEQEELNVADDVLHHRCETAEVLGDSEKEAQLDEAEDKDCALGDPKGIFLGRD
jgi:hypothetical protein